MPAQELICENFEITVGEDDAGAVLTFDIDDLAPITADSDLVDVVGLAKNKESLRITFSHFNGSQSTVVFPTSQASQEALEEIMTTYGRLFVAALGDGKEPGSSAIIFSREMLLN